MKILFDANLCSIALNKSAQAFFRKEERSCLGLNFYIEFLENKKKKALLGSLLNGLTRLPIEKVEFSNYANITYHIKLDYCQDIEKSSNPQAIYLLSITPANKGLADLCKKADMAEIDYLTELPNRLALLDFVNNDLLEQKTKFNVCFFDLNGFKKINDMYGHHTGDLVLKEVANRFKELETDFFKPFRLGGDEFIVISRSFTDSSIAGLKQCALSLEDRLSLLLNRLKDPIILKNHPEPFSIGSAVGVCSSEHANSLEELLEYADAAMYKSKQDGSIVFHKSDHAADIELKFNSRLWLQKDDFELMYQPVVNAQSGNIQYAESLIRWKDAKGTLRLPNNFLPIAHKAGLSLDIDKWVLMKSVQALKQMTQAGVYLPLAVNLSDQALTWEGMPGYIGTLLEKQGVPSSLIHLEITESVLIENMEKSLTILKKLVELGITLILDDFGSAYSSFIYLMSFPVSGLKIDKAFVARLTEGSSAEHIIEGICKLAHKLKLKVTVEGVENIDQLNKVKDLGCDYIQGFWYYKPLSIQNLIDTVCLKSS